VTFDKNGIVTVSDIGGHAPHILHLPGLPNNPVNCVTLNNTYIVASIYSALHVWHNNNNYEYDRVLSGHTGRLCKLRMLSAHFVYGEDDNQKEHIWDIHTGKHYLLNEINPDHLFKVTIDGYPAYITTYGRTAEVRAINGRVLRQHIMDADVTDVWILPTCYEVLVVANRQRVIWEVQADVFCSPPYQWSGTRYRGWWCYLPTAETIALFTEC